MPFEASGYGTEPVFTYSGCICRYGQFGKHEQSCVTNYSEPKKPLPRASARAWKRWERHEKTKVKGGVG